MSGQPPYPDPRDDPRYRYGGAPPPQGHPDNRYGAPPPRDDRYGAPPPRDDRYGAPPPRDDRYGAPPPRDDRYGAPPPRDDRYGAPPPRDDRYGAPPPRDDRYGAPPPRDDRYGAPPPRDDRYGAPPPRDDRYGAPPPPRDDRYGAPPPRDDRYGAPPPRDDRYGAPAPRDDRYGAPPPRDDRYGAPPPRDDRYGAPPPRDDRYGAPPPRDDRYGAPPPRDTRYGAPPPARDDGYRAPAAHGAPPPRDDRYGGGRDAPRNEALEDRYGRGVPPQRPPPTNAAPFRGGAAVSTATLKENEVTAVRSVSEALLPQMFPVVTNYYPLHIKPAPVCWYRISYDLSQAGVDVDTSENEGWKLQAQDAFLYKALEDRAHRESVVSLGHAFVSPKPFPDESLRLEVQVWLSGSSNRSKGENVRINVSITRDFSVTDLASTPDTFVLNNIIDAAFSRAYPIKIRDRYIDFALVDHHQASIGVLRGICPKVSQITANGKKEYCVQLQPVSKVFSERKCTDLVDLTLRSKRRDMTEKQALCEAFVGKKVATQYGAGTGTVYRVLDIDFSVTPQTTFTTKKNGVARELTFATYFQEKYNITLSPNQPFFKARLVSEMRRPACLLPLQVCCMMEPDQSQRELLPTICSIFAPTRQQRIDEALAKIRNAPAAQAMLDQFGVSIGDKPVCLNGSLASRVKVLIPTRNGFDTVDTSVPTMIQGGFARSLGALNHSRDQSRAQTVSFHVIGDRRVNVNRQSERSANEAGGPRFQLQGRELNTPHGDPLSALPTIERELAQQPETHFCMVHLDRKVLEPYREAKSWLMERGILSQFTAKDHDKPTNFKMIGQQMTAKVSGLNWFVDIHDLCKIPKDRVVLLVGSDVSSAVKTASRQGKSTRAQSNVAAFVAFIIAGDRWYSYVNHVIETGKSMVLFRENAESDTMSTASVAKSTPSVCAARHLGPFVTEALEHFKTKRGLTPHHIVISQGGVPDGEVSKVIAEGEPLLTDAIGSERYTWIFALRRNNMRFSFDIKSIVANCPLAAGTLTNPPRGFVTEEGLPGVGDPKDPIALPGFYINSANCTLGHAKPVKYVVHKRGSGIEGDGLKKLEDLFNALCFLYPNKSDGLPYPLPLKCADRYANHLAEQIDIGNPALQTLHPALRTRLFFL